MFKVKCRQEEPARCFDEETFVGVTGEPDTSAAAQQEPVVPVSVPGQGCRAEAATAPCVCSACAPVTLLSVTTQPDEVIHSYLLHVLVNRIAFGFS